MEMLLDLFGKTLFACLASQDQSCPITGRNLTTEPGLFPGIEDKNLYSTPWYPQSNGQAEASNKTLLIALKKRLDSAKGKWEEELPEVLWAYRTTARKPTDISPFVLTYGMEAVIPTEIGLPTIRTATPESENAESIARESDMNDEQQEDAAMHITSY